MSAVPALPTAADPSRDDRLVDLPGVGPLRLRLYGCETRCAGKPLVLHFHGGAFNAGTLDDGVGVAQALVEAGAAVASVDYPLAPGRPFPHALEAGYAALQWLHAQRKPLLHARAPLFVAGEEAGGNLAAAVAMITRDRDGPALAGAILFSPMVDMCVATASQRDARNGPVGCRWADGWRAYLSRDDDAVHPYAVPSRSLRLGGLPPTLLLTSLDDPLRDETQDFARRLSGAGVPAALHVRVEPTGWPRSYRSSGAAWSAALREPLHRFLHPATSTSTSRGSLA